MMAYHYTIQKEADGYTFRLYPNNNNSQEMGMSNLFQTEKECQSALKEFQACGTLFQNDQSTCEIIQNEERFYFYFHFGIGKYSFYRKNGYEEKDNCKEGIKSIIANIDAPLKVI